MNQPLYHNAQRILDCLTEQPMTASMLAPILHIHKESVGYGIDRLRQHKLIYVIRYDKVGTRGMPAKVWAVGDLPNAKRPKPLTIAAKTAAWRSRGNDSHRTRAARVQANRIERHGLMAALLGV